LWKQSAHAKLLHQSPASRVSAKQAALFSQSIDYTQLLSDSCEKAAPLVTRLVQQGHTQHQVEFVEAVLAARPVSSLARLLVWLQQQPELLQLHTLEIPEGKAGYQKLKTCLNYGDLWVASAGGESVQL
jgi:hypothetical protein